MKKILVSALAAGATLLALTTPAYASTDPVGQKCRFNSATDVTAEAQTQFGYIEIGSLLITSSTEPVAAWCQLYVNGVPAPDARLDATITPLGSNLYEAHGAGTMTAHVNVGDVVVMCTFATYDGATHYWQPGPPPPAVPTLGGWATGSTVLNTCSQSTQIDPNPQACPPLLTIDKYAGTSLAVIWQDCEPYSPIV